MATNDRVENFKFSVDTHLFRELGELLVGRDSTALVELIKNAYDADATRVTVRGEDLLGPDGWMTVSDNGIGMTPEVFEDAFLRIAGRQKEAGARVSPIYRRRYTGAKGVGRLSAHKLAQRVSIDSTPRIVGKETRNRRGVRAVIDWQRVEDDYETLEDAANGLYVRTFVAAPQDPPGTVLRLEELRRRWTRTALTDFVTEVSSCTPPRELLALPPDALFPNEHLAENLVLSTRDKGDPGFNIHFEGLLDVGDDLWPQLLEQTDWMVDIAATAEAVVFNIVPSRTQEQAGLGADYQLYRAHPDPERGPFFSARIYARQGSIDGTRAAALRRFARRSRGVRVYVEGFRVLPYGDEGDDWLGLDRDYARRQRDFEIDLDPASARVLGPVEKEGFLVQGNDQYAGAVFMTAEGSRALRPVVNREGFVPDSSYEHLRELVRNGVDLLTRARASHRRGSATKRLDTLTSELLEDGRGESQGSLSQDLSSADPVQAAQGGEETGLELPISVTRSELRSLQKQLGAVPEVSPRLERIEKAIDYIEEAARGDEGRATLQILAGVGLQLAAFVHDINGILGLANTVRSLTEAARREQDGRIRSRLLRDLDGVANELVQSLARQSSYLVEVAGPDARRRRRRLPYEQAIQPSLRLLTSTITERRIDVRSELAPGARTPPIFPAEMSIIVTNLLTNAIKAAGEKGRILIRAQEAGDGGLLLRVENSGIRVDVAGADRWFRPFESTTTEVDIVLGQGMGMGLPIVRRLLSEYNGTVQFVNPLNGYSTAIEVFIPGRKVGR